MNPEEATASTRPAAKAEEVIFTLDRANRALVLIRKVVADIVTQYNHLLELRTRRQETAVEIGAAPRAVRLQEDIEHAIERLNRLHDELTGIGCVLKDWAAGLVDFPALYQGRRICLCWRLGEPAVTYWHELNTGFAGRQPVGPDFA